MRIDFIVRSSCPTLVARWVAITAPKVMYMIPLVQYALDVNGRYGRTSAEWKSTARPVVTVHHCIYPSLSLLRKFGGQPPSNERRKIDANETLPCFLFVPFA